VKLSEWLVERWPLNPEQVVEARAVEAPALPPGEQTARPGSKSLRAKKAEALHRNLRELSELIARHGIERVAFVTLTFAGQRVRLPGGAAAAEFPRHKPAPSPFPRIRRGGAS
jgi:hypothetical protein